MEIIKLNLIPSGVNSICHCSQYDNGRVIRLELFDGLTPYTLQSGDTVTLNVRKPDNTIITASVTATQGNNYVDIVTTEQMCACVGNNLCDLTITNGSVVIGTLNFYMQVERDVLADGISSQSVIKDLDALVQEAVGDNYYNKTEIDGFLNGINGSLNEVRNATILNIDTQESITFEVIPKKLIRADGSLFDYNQTGWSVSELIDIESYNSLIVTAGSGYNFLVYAFYNSSETFISGLNSGSSVLNITAQSVEIPNNAKYIRLARNANAAMALIGVKNEIKNSAIFKWYGKKWSCVGDSLTEVNDRTTKHYHDYIAEETGISVVNMGYGGSGYRALAASDKAFYQRILNVPQDSDVVTIFGSFNDGISDLGTADDTGTTTIGGCINTTIDNLYTIIPTVQLGIVSPTPWQAENPYTAPSYNAYADLLEAICKKRSIPFLNLYYESNLRPWDSTFRTLAYSKDGGNGVHPDETGHKIIAPRFKGFLESLLL